jgi:hypothetical protein
MVADRNDDEFISVDPFHRLVLGLVPACVSA